MTWVDLKANSEEMVKTTRKKYGERTEKKVKSMSTRKNFPNHFLHRSFSFHPSNRLLPSFFYFFLFVLALFLISTTCVSGKKIVLWEHLIISENVRE